MRNRDVNKKASLARFSATVDPEVFEQAKAIADESGFRFSFSAYLNELLKREIQQKRQLCSARV